MLFDLKTFVDASVSGIPLVLFVMILTTWLGDLLGAQGKQKMLISMAVGLVFGVGYQVSQGMPGDFAGWFAIVVYGVTLGLIASGTWDTGKALLEKVVPALVERLIERLIERPGDGPRVQ